MAPQYDLTLRDYWRILRKRKLIVIFTTILLGVFSTFFAILQTPVPLYEASSSVKIERSSTLTGLYVEALSWSSADTLETQAIIIKSYPVMEEVAKRLHFLNSNLTSDKIRSSTEYLNVVLRLKGQVETKQEGLTNIINITATSEDPKIAQKLANTVAEVYRDQNTKERNKRIIEGRIFVEQQLELAKKSLREAEEKVKEYREENKFISIDSETGITLDQLTKIETEYEGLKRTIEEIDLILKRLKKEEAIPEKDIKGIYADKVGPIFGRLNSQLVDLTLERDTLLLNFTKEHPRIKEIKTKIRETIQSMIAELSDQKKTLKGREANLGMDLNGLRKKFIALPQKGLILSRLEHDLKVKAEVFSLLESKYQEALIKEAEKVEEVSVVKPAIEPTSPINPPHVYTTSLIGAILGLVIGLIMAFVFETLDTSIGTIEDVESFLEVPVIGIIPHVGFEEIKEILLKKHPGQTDDDILRRNARLVTHFAPKSMLAESYRTLRTNVQFISLDKGTKTLLFTSSSPAEGKTTTVVNLAVTMAQAGKKILLVESDIRKPMISTIFGIDREPGLTDVVLGNYEWQDTIRTVTDIMTGKMSMEDIMLTPGIDNLNIITSGTIPPNPSEILLSQRMEDFISQVREEYDAVLFDSAPTLATADAAILGSKLDGVIIVYKVGKIYRGALRRAKVQLENVNAKVLGVILNGLTPEVSPDFADFRYDRYYAYGETEETTSSGLQRWFPLYDSFMRLFKREKGKGVQEEVEGKNRWLKITVLGLALSFLIGGLFWKITPQQFISHRESLKEALRFQIVDKNIKPIVRKSIESNAGTGKPPQSNSTQKPGEHTQSRETAKIETPQEKESPISKEFMKPLLFTDMKDKYPYTVQVSAYKQRDSAFKEVISLRSKGIGAYSSLVLLDNGVEWHRVEIGAFESKKEAEEFAYKLRSSMGFLWAGITKTPYTIEIGNFIAEKDLKRKEAELIAMGYSPYVFVSDSNSPKKRLLVGAFYSKEQAFSTSEQLKEKGIKHSISHR